MGFVRGHVTAALLTAQSTDAIANFNFLEFYALPTIGSWRVSPISLREPQWKDAWQFILRITKGKRRDGHLRFLSDATGSNADI